MANALYGKGKEHLLNGDIDIDTATIKAILLSSSYVPSLSTHEIVSDVSTYRLNTDQTLTSVTKALGVVDAADVTSRQESIHVVQRTSRSMLALVLPSEVVCNT